MSEQESQSTEQQDLARGLPMFSASDPEALSAEKAKLSAVQNKGLLTRWKTYFSMTGPGWLQSAMTLGAGSAVASLFLGAYYQYRLLWIQPLAMVLGIIMLSAMSYQTLTTGARPFDAMRKFIHPAMAWAWALAALAATVIWHFPQYGLAAGMLEDMVKAATNWEPTGAKQTILLLAIGTVFLIISTKITWNYEAGHKGIRIYEKALKGMVWMIILAFGTVVIYTTAKGMISWGDVCKGFLPLHIPTDSMGIAKITAAFSAAVGINMTFLFPYTLLARGWGKEHRGLSRFDLITGMLVPYCLATFLMVIATGGTIYYTLENLNVSDIKDLPALTKQVTTEGALQDPSPSRQLWQELDEDAQTLLEDVAMAKEATDEQKIAFCKAVNTIIAKRDFYTEKDFAGIQAKLPANTKDILKKDRTKLIDKEIRLLNRQTLDTAFPDSIKTLSLRVTPAKAAGMFEAVGISPIVSRYIFGLGILGIVLSSITLQMLMAGFGACEIFKLEPGGRAYKLACLIPAPGMLGVVLWKYMGTWIAVPTSAICGVMLPIAYIGFFLLNNNKKYLGDATPRGGKALLWNLGMLIAIAASLGSAAYYIYSHYI
jgi:Mn2+/Fe2+ NRAMP family transporter